MNVILFISICFIWISRIRAHSLQISDEDPKLVTVKLSIDDEEFKRLNDEEFEEKLIETLMTTLAKSKTEAGHGYDNGAIIPEKPQDEEASLDSWSVVWYIASFGGLIAFFLIISCSEWCCRKSRNPSSACPRSSASPIPTIVPDTPPPSYDHFAPPSYDSLTGRSNIEKTEFDVYVVPVHALRPVLNGDAPPSYTSTSEMERVTT